MLIGYARVSTEEQNLALQLDALRRAECRRVFRDEGVSGVACTRPALSKALASLRKGDVLVTWKLDRLGRSLSHLIDVIEELEDREIGFRSLSEAIDTTTSGGKLLFHIIGAIAEFERTLISERTRAGMASARARGVAVGRPRKLAAADVEVALLALRTRSVTKPELATALGVSSITLERALKRRGLAA